MIVAEIVRATAASKSEMAAGGAGVADLYVQLDFKLVHWSFLDWRIVVKTSTPLYMLKRAIVERHGRMAELHIYKDAVLPENELSNGT